MLFLSFEQGYISEEYTSKNPGFSYNEYDRFDFDSIQERECKYTSRKTTSNLWPTLFNYLYI